MSRPVFEPAVFVGAVCPAVLVLLLGCSSSSATGGSSSGTTGTGGATSNDAAASDSGAVSVRQPTLPAAPASCPELQTGMVTVQGQQVRMWVGTKQADKKGPVLFYWHGTSSVSAEISAFMGPMIQEVQDEGGIVASFETSVGTGDMTGPFVWHVDDYVSADIILACAIQQLNIDTQRIYAAGCSAGGLQAGTMVYARASYLAAAMPNSGGATVTTTDDPTHIPAIITTHGSYAADFVAVHFADVAKATDQSLAALGGAVVDCDHGGGHCGATPEIVAAQWQFLKDHPFGVAADPYADGLPPSFPSICTKVTAPHDQ